MSMIKISRVGQDECVGCVSEGLCNTYKREGLCDEKPLSYCPCCTCSAAHKCGLQKKEGSNYHTIGRAGEILKEIMRQQDRFTDARIMPNLVSLSIGDFGELAAYCHMTGRDKPDDDSRNMVFGMVAFSDPEIKNSPEVEAWNNLSYASNAGKEQIGMRSVLTLREDRK